tara:strand:+ start:231 stop:470 length:240 start_codon:yes stop_codon:yes gene_type:complete
VVTVIVKVITLFLFFRCSSVRITRFIGREVVTGGVTRSGDDRGTVWVFAHTGFKPFSAEKRRLCAREKSPYVFDGASTV